MRAWCGAEGILPKILQALASGDPLRNREEKQAVCKQFADLLWFVMEFDELKVSVVRGQRHVQGGEGLSREVHISGTVEG